MKMTLEDVCIVDWEMAQLEGKMRPSIESGMHAAVYENRPDVNVVIHTHQVSASAVALTNRSIPALFDEQVRYLGTLGRAGRVRPLRNRAAEEEHRAQAAKSTATRIS